MLNYYPYQITQYSLMNIEIDKLFTMSNMSNMGTITKSTIHISFQIQLIFTVCFIEFVPISPFLFLSFSVCSLFFCFFQIIRRNVWVYLYTNASNVKRLYLNKRWNWRECGKKYPWKPTKTHLKCEMEKNLGQSLRTICFIYL